MQMLSSSSSDDSDLDASILVGDSSRANRFGPLTIDRVNMNAAALGRSHQNAPPPPPQLLQPQLHSQAGSRIQSKFHSPLFKSTRENGKYTETRKHCAICKRRINTFCKECTVALCFGDASMNISCWEKYHDALSHGL